MPTSRSRQQQPVFEDLYRQLEERVSLLEQGGLSLDDSLKAYEDAVTLARSCQQLLDSAELRITRLRATIAAGDDVDDEPAFEPDEEEDA